MITRAILNFPEFVDLQSVPVAGAQLPIVVKLAVFPAERPDFDDTEGYRADEVAGELRPGEERSAVLGEGPGSGFYHFAVLHRLKGVGAIRVEPDLAVISAIALVGIVRLGPGPVGYAWNKTFPFGRFIFQTAAENRDKGNEDDRTESVGHWHEPDLPAKYGRIHQDWILQRNCKHG